ncbi:hypothetical protein AV929_11820 [Haloarcula sp. K1]|nr:hypothetical protein AV929_11820 [Haloarcula sp. K1]
MLAGGNPKNLFPSYFENVGQSTKQWNTAILENPLIQRFESQISSSLSTETKQKMKKIAERLGAQKEDLGENRLQEIDSLLDDADSPCVISLPGINEDAVNRELKDLITPGSPKSSSDFSGYIPSIESSAFERKALSADADRLIRLLDAVESRQHDFVICHFFSIDLVQHIWADTPSKLERWYGIYDDYVGRVRQSLSENDTLVLVSDHGMETEGIHSKRAFYAANKQLWEETPRKMEDFRGVLESELQEHSSSDDNVEDNTVQISGDTRKHLSELGYFD